MRRALALVVAAVLLAGCSSSSGKPKDGGPNGTTGELAGTITVLAAASLTDAFNEIGRRFQTQHPQVSVTFSFGASSTLVQQVKAGAPADAIATADEITMADAVQAGAVGKPEVFAHNRLAIIVAKGNPKGIRSLADLARAGLVVVLCAPEVPCGRFAGQALEKAGTKVTPKSLEPTVKAVVTKVTLGEADAGIVYTTDVQAAGSSAEGVAIPDAQNVVADYPIAPLKTPKSAALAAAFVEFVRGPDGQDALKAAGFAP